MKPAISIALLAGLIALSAPSVFTQNSSPTLAVSVVGTNVSASWTPVPGATNYRVDVGTYSGGTNVVSANVGGALAAGGALGIGTYYMKVFPLAVPTWAPRRTKSRSTWARRILVCRRAPRPP